MIRVATLLCLLALFLGSSNPTFAASTKVGNEAVQLAFTNKLTPIHTKMGVVRFGAPGQRVMTLDNIPIEALLSYDIKSVFAFPNNKDANCIVL